MATRKLLQLSYLSGKKMTQKTLPQEAWAVGAAHLPLDRLFGGPHDLAASMAPATAASATMALVRLPGSCCA